MSQACDKIAMADWKGWKDLPFFSLSEEQSCLSSFLPFKANLSLYDVDCLLLTTDHPTTPTTIHIHQPFPFPFVFNIFPLFVNDGYLFIWLLDLLKLLAYLLYCETILKVIYFDISTFWIPL